MQYLIAFRLFDDIQTNIIELPDNYSMKDDKLLKQIKIRLTTNDDLASPIYTPDGTLRPEFINSYRGLIAITKLY